MYSITGYFFAGSKVLGRWMTPQMSVTPSRPLATNRSGVGTVAGAASRGQTNPPSAEDAPMVAKLAKIGVVPGQDFDAAKLDPAVAKGLAGAPKPAQEVIMDWLKAGVAAGEFAGDRVAGVEFLQAEDFEQGAHAGVGAQVGEA